MAAFSSTAPKAVFTVIKLTLRYLKSNSMWAPTYADIYCIYVYAPEEFLINMLISPQVHLLPYWSFRCYRLTHQLAWLRSMFILCAFIHIWSCMTGCCSWCCHIGTYSVTLPTSVSKSCTELTPFSPQPASFSTSVVVPCSSLVFCVLRCTHAASWDAVLYNLSPAGGLF